MKKALIAGIVVVVVALGVGAIILYNNANDRREKQQSLSTAITAAMDAKKSGDWTTAVMALQKPLDALGTEQAPNRELAESLLKEARAEVKKRDDFTAKIKEANALLADAKFPEAQGAFEAAKTIFPESPQMPDVTKGIDTARREVDRRKLFADKLQDGKKAFESNDWPSAISAFEAAKSAWAESPQVGELDGLLTRAKGAAEKEQQLKAEADRAKQEAAAKQHQIEYEQSWPDRATAAAKQLFEGEATDKIASAVKDLTHPTGSNAKISAVTAARQDDNVVVQIDVSFAGNLTGNRYTTSLKWTFNKGASIGVEIPKDTAPFGIEVSQRGKLNKWFSENVFPLVTAAAK